MTIELGGMNLLLDARGNPILYEGDVVAVQFLRSYEDIRRDEVLLKYWEHIWKKPLIVTEVSEKGFFAKYPFNSGDFETCEFEFGTVNIKLLARGSDE